MKKMTFVVVIGLAASVVLVAAQEQSKKPVQEAPHRISAVKPVSPTLTPLNANTGLWQITQTVAWTGLPPQTQQMMQSMTPAHTYKSCVRTKNLSSNPWAEGSGMSCTWTVLTSNGTDMEIKGTSCKSSNDNFNATGDLHGKIHMLDAEHGTGSDEFTLNFNGQTMHGHASYTGKWIAATCPADMN